MTKSHSQNHHLRSILRLRKLCRPTINRWALVRNFRFARGFHRPDPTTSDVDYGIPNRCATSSAAFPTSSAVCADQNPYIGVIVYNPLRPNTGEYRTTDPSEWVIDWNAGRKATGFADCVNLGHFRPDLARKNAPNYVHFALCLAFDYLDCTGEFA